MQNSMSCGLVPCFRRDAAGDDELVGGSDECALTVGQTVGVGTLEDLGLDVRADTATAGQPTVLLQFVFAIAEVADPQDDGLGVLHRQLGQRSQQHCAIRRPGQEQKSVLAKHIDQAEPRRPDRPGADLGNGPIERPEFLESARRNARGLDCAHRSEVTRTA
jgi:hypothetical protein